MNSLKIVFLLACLICCIAHSCTVTKRVHRKGYYVEWHTGQRLKNHPDIGKSPLSHFEKTTDSLVLDHRDTERIPDQDLEPEAQANVSENLPAFPERNKPLLKPKKSTENEKKAEFIPAHQQKLSSKPDVRPVPEEHPLAILGVFFGVFGLFLPLLGFPLSLLAVIFGAIAQKSLRKDPGKYEDTKTAIMLGIIGLIIALSIIAFFFILFLMW